MNRKLAFALALGASFMAAPLPAIAQAEQPDAVDPARLEFAETIAAKLIPHGSYQRMMKAMVDQMAEGMIEQVMGMDAAIMAIAARDDAKNLKGKSLGELATQADPHFKERMDIMMKVMFDEMGKLMNEMEPAARQGLARVYARKYDIRQLAEMNAFFATSSGSTFAADFMSTFTDREMMQAMMGEMPKMIEAMPAIIKKVEDATAHLPPVPNTERYQEASSETPMPECADDGDDSDCSEEDAAQAAAVAAVWAAEDADRTANGVAEGETGDEPWYLEDNWAVARRDAVNSLSEKYNQLQSDTDAAAEAAGTAYTVWEKARDAAVEETRARFKKAGWTPSKTSE